MPHLQVIMGTSPTTLREEYEESRQRVEQGRRHILRQQEIVSALGAGNHDASEARSLLALFMELQERHVAHMCRLQQQLDSARTQITVR